MDAECVVLERLKGEGRISSHSHLDSELKRDVIILSIKQIESLFASVDEMFGIETARSLFYANGLAAGRTTGSFNMHELGLHGDAFWENWRSCIGEMGLGYAKVVDLEVDGEAFMRTQNAFPSRKTRGSPVPACSFISGYFAGTLEVFWGTQVHCVEERCESMGDPHCEFRAKPY